MKLNISFLSVAGILAASLAATAQTAAPAGDTSAPAPTTSAVESTNRDPNAVIPSIVMEGVPLTDVIKSLARQANINYMLDPKIPFLAPGPDGKSQQPNVDLRLVNVTPDQALNALLNNYSLALIDDPKTKISRITVKDPAAPDPLTKKIIQLKYADPSNLVDKVQTVLVDKRSKVVPEGSTSQLIVLATDKEMADVDELVARVDRKKPEVLIETRLIETSKNPTTAKGVDWSGTLQQQNITFGNGTTTGTVGYNQAMTSGGGTGNGALGQTGQPFVASNAFGGIFGTSFGNVMNEALLSSVGNGGLSLNTAKGFYPYTAFLNADGVQAALSFLNTSADAKVISTPRTVTQDNQEAVLSVTRAQPIFATTAGTQGSPGGSQVTYTNLGTILTVRPRISANDMINLKVVPEVSDLAGTITKTVAGTINQADFFDVRRIETTVDIPSGNTLVMGGLVSDNSTVGNTKVPLLGDIPGLGWLFREESKTQNKKDLVIFITPTIVHDEDFQPTSTSFLKSRFNDKPTADFNAWDSGEPQDWSHLVHSKAAAGSDDDGGVYPAATTK